MYTPAYAAARGATSRLLGAPGWATTPGAATCGSAPATTPGTCCPRVTAPTLVLHGSDDRMAPVANAELLAGRIPGAELHVYDGMRHGFFDELRDRVGARVLAFLRDAVPRARPVAPGAPLTEPSAYFVPGRARPLPAHGPHRRGLVGDRAAHQPARRPGGARDRGHAAAASGADDGRSSARLSLDILGVVAIEEIEIAVRTVRPGRTIELVEALVTCAGRTVVLARAWRLAGATRPRSPAAPAADPAARGAAVLADDVGLARRLHRLPRRTPGRRRAARARHRLGLLAPRARSTAWTVSPLASYVALVDTANGICVREPTDAWLFPNVDLTLHLHRQPVAGPVGLDTTVVFGADGPRAHRDRAARRARAGRAGRAAADGAPAPLTSRGPGPAGTRERDLGPCPAPRTHGALAPCPSPVAPVLALGLAGILLGTSLTACTTERPRPVRGRRPAGTG